MESIQETGEQISGERVQALFQELKRLRDELEMMPAAGEGSAPGGRQIDLPNVNSANVFFTAEAVCPFLKAGWNSTVQYGFPNDQNSCYRGKKPKPVTLEHQEQFCYTKLHRKCPLAAPVPIRRRLLALLENFFYFLF